MKAKLALLSLVLLAGASTHANLMRQDPKSLIGKPAPKLLTENWANSNGKPLSLAKLKGKVVVLDFWAYW